MDIDPGHEPPHDEQVPTVAPEAAPVVAPTAVPTRSSRSGRRLVPFALLGIMTVGAGLGAFFAVRESTTPSEALSSALTHTLDLKTAAINSSVVAEIPGGNTTITIKGAASFETDVAAQDMQIASGNERVDERIVSDGSHIFVHIDGGVIAKIVAGKSWVSISTGQSAASSVAGSSGAGNSAAILRVLSAPGNDVADLGFSRVSGNEEHRYSVHLTRAQIKQDVAQEHLPLFMRQAIAIVQIPAVTYTMAINGENELTRLTATVVLQAGGQHINEFLTQNFSHYGTKVSVKVPPSSEVVPFERFLQIAQAENQHVTI